MEESALAAAVRDAAGSFNPEATRPQTLVFITDGVQLSHAQGAKKIYADAVRGESGTESVGKARVRPYAIDCRSGGCNLGEPHFKVPKATCAIFLGIGLDIESDQQQKIKTG
jgi:hypothetical protein